MSAKDRETANVGAGLWKGLGMWAWVLFRISGLILVAYLFVHVWVISQGRAGADELERPVRLLPHTPSSSSSS